MPQKFRELQPLAFTGVARVDFGYGFFFQAERLFINLGNNQWIAWVPRNRGVLWENVADPIQFPRLAAAIKSMEGATGKEV
ncbi:MAG: hypothetical protein ABGX22_09015 [Pirellulaceae bacterium]